MTMPAYPSNSNAWEELWTRFHELVELQPTQVAQYLDRIGDKALRGRLGRMLETHIRSDLILDRPPPIDPRSAAPASRHGGARIGAYTLIELIGSGGMAEVYLARRTDELFDQKVAIKILDQVLDEQACARFDQERRVLAKLEHRNIVRILDGGVTDDGAPFLVMDFIAGTPIDGHCQDRSLSLDQRLRLFVDVCDAVQFAHQHWIIHCDLKPTNVLVSRNGEPVLLDFGIAQILDGKRQDHRLDGRGACFTPGFASPEQLESRKPGPAWDIYSLGSILARILAASSGDDPDGRVRRWRTSTRELRAIVEKCTRQDPGERYGSAEQLASDVRAFRAHRPLVAYPASTWLRTTKFLRRNGLPVALLAGVFALISGFALVFRSQLKATQQALAVAAVEKRKSDQILTTIVNQLAIVAPDQHQAGDLSAKELLSAGLANAQRSLADHPLILAEVQWVIGRLYRNLGMIQEADSTLAAAIDVRRAVVGAGDSSLAKYFFELGALRLRASAPEEAIVALVRAIRLQQSVAPHPVVALAKSRRLLARALVQVTRVDEAKAQLEANLKLANRLPSFDSANDCLQKALILTNEERIDEAEVLAARAEELFERSGVDHAPTRVGLLVLRARIDRYRGQLEHASRWIEEALRLAEQSYRRASPSLSVLRADLCHHAEQYLLPGAAETACRQAISALLVTHGADDPQLPLLRAHLGAVLYRLGQTAEAERLLRKSRRELAGKHAGAVLFNASSASLLAAFLAATGRLDEASRQAADARRLLRAHRGAGAYRLASVLSLQGRIHYLLGELDRAGERFQEAHRLLAERFGEHNLFAVEARMWCGIVAGESAQRILQRVHDELANRQLPEGSWRLAMARVALARVLTHTQSRADAVALLRESLGPLRAFWGSHDWRHRWAKRRLIELELR